MGLINTRPYKANNSVGDVGIFSGGFNPVRAYVDKYVFADETNYAAATLSIAREGPVGMSNDTVGRTIGGHSGAGYLKSIESYTYGTDSMETTNGLAIAKFMPCAASNNVFGIVAAGYVNGAGAGVDTTERHDYSLDTYVNSITTSIAAQRKSGCGSPTIGYLAGGRYDFAEIDKYNFSANTVAIGTALSAGRYAMGAASSDTVGIFAGGGTAGGATPVNTIEVYTFATNIVSGGSNSLGLIRHDLAGASDGIIGIFAGGYDTALSVPTDYTDKYIFLTGAISQSSDLGIARYEPAGMSNAHGGL